MSRPKLDLRARASALCLTLGLVFSSASAGAGKIPGTLLFDPPSSSAGAENGFQSPARDDYRLNGDFIKRFAFDLRETWTSPLRWKSGDWLVGGAVAGATAAFFAFDRRIYEGIQSARTDASRDASSVISKFGNGGVLAGFIAALYAGGSIFDDVRWRRTALLGLESFVATTAIVFGLKAVIGRARPYADEGAQSFHPFSFRGRYTSFCSGDAAGAFAVASVVAGESESFLVDVLAYGLAGLAAVYRVHDGQHWPSDVVAGSILGTVIGRTIVRLGREHDRAGRSADVRIAFGPVPGGSTAVIVVRF